MTKILVICPYCYNTMKPDACRNKHTCTICGQEYRLSGKPDPAEPRVVKTLH